MINTSKLLSGKPEPAPLTVRDFSVFQFSWLLLPLGVIYDSPSWLFWLTSLPVLCIFLFGLTLSLHSGSRAAPGSGPHIPFIWSPAHVTLYMCWPRLSSLECSVIRKSAFPAVWVSRHLLHVSATYTSSRVIVSSLYSQNLPILGGQKKAKNSVLFFFFFFFFFYTILFQEDSYLYGYVCGWGHGYR